MTDLNDASAVSASSSGSAPARSGAAVDVRGPRAAPTRPELSIVIPFFNEEPNVAGLTAELRATVDAQRWRTEVIFVDDGSTDGTGAALDRVAAGWAGCRVVHFASNCGQGAALWHGLHLAEAPVVAMMDGDGQNMPGDLPGLLRRLDGADLVVGWRMNRHDSWLRRMMSRVANRVRGWVLRDRLHDTGCALKVMRREVIDSLLPIVSLNQFLPAMAVGAGYRVTEHRVHHRPRLAGVSKYSLRVLWWRPLCDLLALKWVLARRIPSATVRSGRNRGASGGPPEAP